MMGSKKQNCFAKQRWLASRLSPVRPNKKIAVLQVSRPCLKKSANPKVFFTDLAAHTVKGGFFFGGGELKVSQLFSLYKLLTVLVKSKRFCE